jgi:hypothetical protein
MILQVLIKSIFLDLDFQTFELEDLDSGQRQISLSLVVDFIFGIRAPVLDSVYLFRFCNATYMVN